MMSSFSDSKWAARVENNRLPRLGVSIARWRARGGFGNMDYAQSTSRHEKARLVRLLVHGRRNNKSRA